MYQRKAAEVTVEETKVWVCTSDECNGWVRDNFRSEKNETAVCPLCKSDMKEEKKELPVLTNNGRI